MEVKKENDKNIRDFVIESNAIEQIFRDPTTEEILELSRFMALDKVTVEEIQHFVSVYEPKARLRINYGDNVRIGRYYPPFGGPEIQEKLRNLLSQNIDARELHIKFELLHPFTDCNGRSGRALWAWKNKNINGGFLLNFYYQELEYWSNKTR